MIKNARIEFTKESGEVILTEPFSTELQAQNHFNYLESIFWPNTYEGLTMNLSEYPEGRIGSVRLIATVTNDVTGNESDYTRRELYRKP